MKFSLAAILIQIIFITSISSSIADDDVSNKSVNEAAQKYVENNVFARREGNINAAYISEMNNDYKALEHFAQRIEGITGIKLIHTLDGIDTLIVSSQNPPEALKHYDFAIPMMIEIFCVNMTTKAQCKPVINNAIRSALDDFPAVTYRTQGKKLFGFGAIAKNNIPNRLEISNKPIVLFYALLAHKKVPDLKYASLLSASPEERHAAIEYMEKNEDLTPFDRSVLQLVYSDFF